LESLNSGKERRGGHTIITCPYLRLVTVGLSKSSWSKSRGIWAYTRIP